MSNAWDTLSCFIHDNRDVFAILGSFLAGCATAYKIMTKRHEDSLKRSFVPRAEFDLECKLFGPENGEYAAEIRIIVYNKSKALRSFSGILVRVRGINSGSLLELGARGDQFRLSFPVKIAEQSLMYNTSERPADNTYTVEPGVRQIFTFPTKIPVEIKYILVFVRLTSPPERGSALDFTEERMFPVIPSSPAA